jgi:hypothetical protein
MRIRMIWVPLLTLQFPAATLTSTQTNSSSPTRSPNTPSTEEILAYWTPARMAGAMPQPMPDVSVDVTATDQGRLKKVPFLQGTPPLGTGPDSRCRR